jgi:glycosyltransferase involved in cell wall biosynthesis
VPHLLIVGGSSRHQGGAELFIERASEILRRRGGWSLEALKSNSAYLSLASLPSHAGSLASLVLRRRSADAVWVQYGSLPDLAFVVAARLRGYKVVVTPHLGVNWKSQSRPLLRALSNRALRFAHRLALFSTTQERELDLEGLPRSSIRTFLPERSLSGLPPPEVTGPVLRIVHAARLSEAKGSFLVVDVCAKLRDAGLPFSAEIIGSAEPDVLRRLEQRIAEAGLSDVVRMVGQRSNDDLLDHLRRADVLLHLSRLDSYPLIVLEALACAALPTCLDLPGARNMVETYDGYVVGQDEPAPDAAAILARLDINDIRHRAREASVRVRADYDWTRCGEALDNALNDVVDHKDRMLAPTF